MIKTLILDYARWRCGGATVGEPWVNFKEISTGEGRTCMLNFEGFMCCLGQWTAQIHPEFELLNITQPISLYVPYEFTIPSGDCENAFALECMRINDSNVTTIEHKIISLAEACRSADYSLLVIHYPYETRNKATQPIGEVGRIGDWNSRTLFDPKARLHQSYLDLPPELEAVVEPAIDRSGKPRQTKRLDG